VVFMVATLCVCAGHVVGRLSELAPPFGGVRTCQIHPAG
jgi:hypothetical protein